MRFYQIIALVVLGFCASNMETPPSAQKRGFKLEFVGDNKYDQFFKFDIKKKFQNKIISQLKFYGLGFD